MPARILLVEDNEMNREMLSRRLLRKGYEVVIAVDGLQGVEMAGAQRPQLILMDLSLPGIDGWEATRRIKASPATRAIPVIALTAHAMSDDRAKALAAGCDDFDTKPVDLARLLDKMESLLASTAGAVQAQGPVLTAAPEAPAAQSVSLTLPATHASLPGFKTELEHFCMQTGVAAGVQEDLQVVLDEVCANVFKHAYPPGQPGMLTLELRMRPRLDPGDSVQALELTLTDQGRPFNPLAKAAPDLSLTWEKRPLGGLGIHLVQTLTDHQSYRHSQAEGNRLTLVKRLA
ncbi:MAG: response regulator [Burkholderiales bacterium]|jgi:two-component system cell cycle response regulator DivK|nr:response regulator [Burkholderiales bacterium]MBP7521622.1 response regulator [Leptothrix sp. (in: b-proteobacteria)]HQY07298.1 response regulator [Burkholderiaceae bacterium]